MTEYASSAEHLLDHLRRVEQLVRAQVERWRQAVAEERTDVRWGTGILEPRELARYLGQPFTEPMDDDLEPNPAAQACFVRATALALRIDAGLPAEPPGRLRVERLRLAFGLAQADLDVLLICLLGEWDARYRRLFAYLADEEWRRAPSVGLLAEILRPGADRLAAFHRRFAADAPLLRHGLVALGEETNAGLAARSVILSPRIAAFLGGEDYLDARLAVRLGDPLDADDLVLTPAQRAGLTELILYCRARGGATVALIGAAGAGRGSWARAVATSLGLPLLIAAASADLGKDVYREARLRGAAVLWRGCGALAERSAEDDGQWAALLALAAGHTGPTFVDHAQPWDGSLLRIPFPSPGLPERRALWERLLDGVAADPPALADRLAATFLLTPGRMRDAVRMSAELAARRDPRDRTVTPADLHEACRRQSSRRLMSIARPVEAPAGMTLDDIVLPEDKKRQLIGLRDRVRNRPLAERLLGPGRNGAKGLVAMFAGSSGTGKTLAAGLIAKDLGRDLLKVDLCRVVSKWVGETEKNLDQVLDEAQDAHAILFFDEAEALFGKRGTVTDARDRYAMQEISFLLQRIEEYEGVVILATNLRQNLDEAFSRRIQVVVEFPRPDDANRLRMWHLALSGVAHDLTEAEIAKVAQDHRLSAAAIVEVVVAASFVALGRDPSAAGITAEDIDDGVRAELQRLGLPAAPGLRT